MLLTQTNTPERPAEQLHRPDYNREFFALLSNDELRDLGAAIAAELVRRHDADRER